MEWKPPCMVPSQATTFGRCVVHTSLLCTSLTPTPHEKDDQPLQDWSWISIFVLFISVNLDAMRRPFGKPFHMMLYWGTAHLLRNRHKFGANLVIHWSFAKCESNKCPVINGYWWQTGNRKSDHALGINRNKGLLARYDLDVGLLKTAT